MNEEIHILVVDDNQENLKVISNYLKEKGYKIALALDGISTLEILAENRIDLILLDIMMPGMDGFEVLEKLKQKPETKEIPVIFLTARTDTDDIIKGFQLGAVDYITKPFKREELYARVTNQVQIKLIRELLKKRQEEGINSHTFFSKIMDDLSKIMDQNN